MSDIKAWGLIYNDVQRINFNADICLFTESSDLFNALGRNNVFLPCVLFPVIYTQEKAHPLLIKNILKYPYKVGHRHCCQMVEELIMAVFLSAP